MKKIIIIIFAAFILSIQLNAQDNVVNPQMQDLEPPIEFYTPYLRQLPESLVKSLTDTTSQGIMDFLMRNLPDADKRELKSKMNEYRM